MRKQVEVLGISENSNWGAVVGCHAPEWDGMDENEIFDWFGEFKKLSFENGAVLEFQKVTPCKATCFGNGRGQAVLRLARPPIPGIMTPAIAQLS